MKPACMDDAEYALWDQANRTVTGTGKARRPCSDCPIAFYQEMRRVGCCDGVPQMRMHGPMTPVRLRAQWASAQRRRRALMRLSTDLQQVSS